MGLMTPFCGVYVSGDEIAGPNLAERLRDLVAQHGLVVWQDGVRSPQAFTDLVQELGVAVQPPYLPEVEKGSGVSRLAHSATPADLAESNGVVFASGWHADWTFLEQPPHVSLLWCQEAPEVGGDTLWCDTTEALKKVSPAFRAFLSGLTARHEAADFSTAGLYSRRNVVGATPSTGADKVLSAIHPVLRSNPLTEEECLFVNPCYTTSIVELRDSESRRVLDYLYTVAFWDEHLLRVRWSTNDLAVWDNTRLLHRALNQGVLGRREMLRANVLVGRNGTGPGAQ
jgi:taurine dioxygenase